MTGVWARQQQTTPSVEDEQMLTDGEGQVWKKTWGGPGLGLLNWKYLCTTRGGERCERSPRELELWMQMWSHTTSQGGAIHGM